MEARPKPARESLWELFRQALRGEQTDFTTGSLRRALFILAVPMVLEMAMESLFAVVDVFYVSRVGVDAVAVVGLTESIMMIIYSIAMGLGMAATAFVARRTGEKNMKLAAESAVQALVLTLMISIPIAIVGVVFAPGILKLMGATPTVAAEGANYTRIMLGGNIVVMLLFLNNAIFRGIGNAAIAMRVLWVANLLNMILAPIFIFGLGPIPAMGVTGAAVGTTIGRGLGVLYQFKLLTSDQALIRIRRDELRVVWGTLREMWSVALGGTSQFLIHSASWIFLVRILSGFGSSATAGFTIAIRVIIFTILPSFGLANAAATLVGQNLGAGQPERAEKTVWLAAYYNMLFLSCVSVVFITFAPQVIGFFTSDPAALKSGIHCLRIICLGYVLFAYGMVATQAFNGAGDTKTPMWINIIALWIIQIPVALFFAKTAGMGPTGVYIGQTVAFVAEAAISLVIFRRGKWKLKKI